MKTPSTPIDLLETTPQILDDILARHPRLHGWGYGQRKHDKHIDLPAARADLYDPRTLEGIDLAQVWILRRLRPRKPRPRDLSSYRWKHVMQEETGLYVTNGAFIVALLRTGTPITLAEGRFNPQVHAKLRP